MRDTRALAWIIYNPMRKRGTSNKIPRLRVGLGKAVCKQSPSLTRRVGKGSLHLNCFR